MKLLSYSLKVHTTREIILIFNQIYSGILKRWHEIENVHEVMKDKSLLFHEKYDILYCLDDKFEIDGAGCKHI